MKLDYEVVEINAVKLLAKHIHFCNVCGKGFKRDENLHMHMRAHQNEFKLLEFLAKPNKEEVLGRSESLLKNYINTIPSIKIFYKTIQIQYHRVDDTFCGVLLECFKI